jgi:methionine synthase I (cobalamin-dependent)
MALNLNSLAAKVRVTDGATGTRLHKQGLTPGTPTELWNTDNPAAVQRVASDYIRAGSEIILTNTFGANRIILAQHGAANRTAELAEAGARIARRAADAAKSTGKDVLVFGSIGPSGKIVMTEEVGRDELLAAFAESAEAIAWGGADTIVLETFNELDELVIAIDAVKGACNLPVVASMTFSSGPDKTHTMMGNSPADLAAAARKHGADAVGANCGVGPDNYVRVAALLRSACDLPIWIKPNAGVPTVGRDGRPLFPMKPQEFASFVPAMIAAGANFIGGCCGTGPGHIEALRAAVDKLATA